MASLGTRAANINDLFCLQELNLKCLPENYSHKYYAYKYITWPSLCFISSNFKNEPIGYVLSKNESSSINEQGPKSVGHITSLGVNLKVRKAGVAKNLMEYVHKLMVNFYNVNVISLHVRTNNQHALHLYKNVFKYTIKEKTEKYYEDGEDAYVMKCADLKINKFLKNT